MEVAWPTNQWTGRAQRSPSFSSKNAPSEQSCIVKKMYNSRRRHDQSRNPRVAGRVSTRILSFGASPQAVKILFSASTLYSLGVAVYMIYVSTREWMQQKSNLKSGGVAPKQKARFPSSPIPLIAPLAIVYAWLLFHSYEPDMISLILPGSLADGFNGSFNPQFFPKLSGIATLFSRLTTAASLWVHVLCINIFAAHSILLKGTISYVVSSFGGFACLGWMNAVY